MAIGLKEIKLSEFINLMSLLKEPYQKNINLLQDLPNTIQ